VPKLQAAGWDNDSHSITEQRYFTKGCIVVRGSRAERRKGKRADYRLTDHTAEKVRTLCASPDELRAHCANAGQCAEIIGKFGGADQLRNALKQLQTLLYAA